MSPQRRRSSDPRIDHIVEKVDHIANILTPEDGTPGLCEKQRENERRIEALEARPGMFRRWIAPMAAVMAAAAAWVTHLRGN